MILPDDKNPKIIWDEKKKCWINTDGDDDGSSSGQMAAPPTDSELLNKVPEKPKVPPSGPQSGINRFQRPKGKGMRQNYVDILNPGETNKPVPTPDLLPPPSGSAMPNLLIPSPVPDPSNTGTSEVLTGPSQVGNPHSQPNTPDVLETSNSTMEPQGPLMFDPAEFSASRTSYQPGSIGRLSRRPYPS
ncbi:protein transport protein Sec16A-like [Tachypleus tridentatus]|uniref:protein transport protein Sec16A-like n=1 Tax=Tachypleus tridentatus TaxID=6853 RepID=UPI003FD589B8